MQSTLHPFDVTSNGHKSVENQDHFDQYFYQLEDDLNFFKSFKKAFDNSLKSIG